MILGVRTRSECPSVFYRTLTDPPLPPRVLPSVERAPSIVASLASRSAVTDASLSTSNVFLYCTSPLASLATSTCLPQGACTFRGILTKSIRTRPEEDSR